jgi:uncharacterized protein YjiS (DUF1127 family)
METDMTATTASKPGILVAGAERTGTWTAGLGKAWSNYLAYRATLAELQDLTDKQLRDIGLGRDALKRIAREAVYGI